MRWRAPPQVPILGLLCCAQSQIGTMTTTGSLGLGRLTSGQCISPCQLALYRAGPEGGSRGGRPGPPNSRGPHPGTYVAAYRPKDRQICSSLAATRWPWAGQAVTTCSSVAHTHAHIPLVQSGPMYRSNSL